MNRSVPALTVGAVLLSLVATPAIAQVKLELAVNDSETALEVVSNNSRCSGDSDPGCIEVKRGKSPNISFEMDGKCKAGRGGFELSGIDLSLTPKQFERPVPDYVARDFDADPDSGAISRYETRNPKKLKIKNRNRGKGNQGDPYTVYYRVVAENCDTRQPIYLDPPIKNGGGRVR